MKHGFFKKGTAFKPGSSITREEMAYALVRAFDLTGESSRLFSDVPKNHTAYGDTRFYYFAKDYGLIGGGRVELNRIEY